MERVESHRRKLERVSRQAVSRAVSIRALLDAGLEEVERVK